MKAHWAGYFERLYQADPPAVELDVRGVTAPIALLNLQSTVIHLFCGNTGCGERHIGIEVG